MPDTMHRFISNCVFTILVFMIAACSPTTTDLPQATSRPIPTLRPTVAQAPAPVAADNTPNVDTDWVAGNSGIELRKLNATIDGRSLTVSIARLDLTQVRLRVGYAPAKPRTLNNWIAQSRPLLLINGGFFDQAFETSALLVSDGATSGTSYEGFGGMLTVAADGATSIQPLRDQPFDTSQALDQGLQSFPMLVFPGGAEPGVVWNGDRDRRSALALDRAGRLLVIACPQSGFTLNEFATWLRTSDLAIDRALNLDGGASTALYVDAGAAQERIEPFNRLPIVLFAEARR